MAMLFVAGYSVRAANVNWTNSNSGGWNTGANWNPNGVPGASDTAIITNAGVTVSLNAATTVGAIILGTNGAGTVTLSLAGQTLSLDGPLTVNPSGSFTVDSGILVGNTNAVLQGMIGWSAGTLGGILTLASGSTLNITAANNHDMPNCTVTNNGTVVWNNGPIRAGGGGGTLIINNGLWDAQSDQLFEDAFGGVGGVFDNYGTFRKSGGTSEFATATIFQGGVVFNQLAGVIDVQNGTNGLEVAFQGGGNLTGGYITTNSQGLTVLSIGSFNLNGTVTGTNTWQDAGNLVGNNVINGALTWVAGTWDTAAVTIATNSTVIVAGGAGNMDMDATVVTNYGTLAWASGQIRGGNGSVVYNYGLWNAQSDQLFEDAFGGVGGAFNNYGTFRKSGGASEFATATIFQGGVVFNQLAGVIDVQNGTNGLEVAFQGGGNFTGGYITTNSQGVTVLSIGSFNLNGTVTGTNTWQDAGNLVGNNVINGALTWVAGTWDFASVTILSNSTVLVIGGTGNNMDMDAAAVTNYGTLTWASGQLRGGNGSVVYNYGLWDAQSDQLFEDAFGGAGAVFNNYGTFRKSGGAGELVGNTVFQNGVVFNQLAGVIDVQQNGTKGTQLALEGGGSFTGGYVTTNTLGLLNLAFGSFIIDGTVTGTNTWLNGGNLVGNANFIKGILTWVAGTWDGVGLTIATNSTVIVAGGGGNNDLQNTTVTNYGTLAWSSGAIRCGGNPGTFIYNYGLWDAQSDQQMNSDLGGAGGVFNNFGTFRKSGGASELTNNTYLTAGVVFNQLAGVIDVRNGTNGLQLAILGGGNFTGGYVTTNTQGLLNLAQGNFNLNGTVTGTNTWQNGASLAGNNVINGALTWIAGTWDGAGVTIATNSTAIVAGGGGNNDLQNTAVTNYGTLAWSSGAIRCGGNPGTFIYNYGLWDAQSDQQMNAGLGGAGGVFNNYGIFRKSGGVGELTGNTYFASGVVFNQLAGMIDVQNGTNGLQLNFAGGGNFTGGHVTTNVNGLTVLGANSFTVNGTVTGTNTWQDAGNLAGNNVINGALTWVAGTWDNAAVTIASNSKVIVAGGGGLNDMANSIVTNNGTVAWWSGTIRCGNNTFIYNYGLWDAQSDQQLNNAFGGSIGTIFNNFGTVRKSAGSGNTVIAGGVLFNQTSGLLSAQTGNILLQGSGNFTGGSITNSGVGTTYLNAGGFNINGTATGSNVVENAGNLVGNNVINGALTWVAGTWDNAVVTITNNSTVIVAGGGGNNDMENTVVTNYGTLEWSSGTIRCGNNTFIYNYGLWDSQSDQLLNNAFGGTIGTIFNNFGTVHKSAGTTNTIFAGGVLFDQTSGLLSALTGNILLQGGGNLTGGTVTSSGIGTTYLNAGSFNINGATTSGNVVENAGNLVGNNVINGTLTWVAGNWDNAAVTIDNGSAVTVAGGGGNNDLGNTVVTNNGTVAWSSGTIRCGNNTFIYNYGLWDAQSDQQLNNAFGGSIGTVFNNFGTVRKEFTSGTTFFTSGVVFTNTGKLDAQSGNIALQGPYTLANGTKMSFGLNGPASNGQISLSGAASFAGSLSVNLNGSFSPAVGSSFNLLNYTSESGVLFTSTTLPALITWQTNYNPTVFTLSVIASSTNSSPTNLTMATLNGTNLDLQWPADHTGWRIQAQTNPVTVGLTTNWVTIPGSGLTNQIIIPIDKANGSVFFRMIYP